jgi:hypothetical protein
MHPRLANPNWHILTATARRLRAGTDRDVALTEIAAVMGWTYEYTQNLAAEMTELSMIETDMGLGCLPTIVEAP